MNNFIKSKKLPVISCGNKGSELHHPNPLTKSTKRSNGFYMFQIFLPLISKDKTEKESFYQNANTSTNSESQSAAVQNKEQQEVVHKLDLLSQVVWLFGTALKI